MKGFYFLIGSFAAGEVIRLIWKWSELTWLFGGPKGIKLIPPFPDIEALVDRFLRSGATTTISASSWWRLSLLILYRIERSRIGLTFHAIHWQDKLAESVGVNTFGYRMLAFVIASFFAGLAGALYAHYVGTVNPNRFSVEEMVYVLIWAIVGGTATFYGPILGVVVLTILNEVVLRALGVDEMRPMLYGAILILFILFLPKGLESSGAQGEELARRRQSQARKAGPAERSCRPNSGTLLILWRPLFQVIDHEEVSHHSSCAGLHVF